MSRSRGATLLAAGLLLLAYGGFSPATTADGKSGDPPRSPFQLKRSVVGAGGAPGTYQDPTGGLHRHNGTLGQSTPIGRGSGREYILHAGFWYGALRATPVAPDAPATMLYQNHPNPFNPMTTIRYALAEPGAVKAAVYDVQGRLVRVLVDEAQPAGMHEVVWDGKDRSGRQVATGLYFCRLRAGDYTAVKKMLLVK